MIRPSPSAPRWMAFSSSLLASAHVLLLLLAIATPGFAEEAAPAAPSIVENDEIEKPASAAARLRTAAAPYPSAVQAAMDEGRRECLAQGGTAFIAATGLVRVGDLTGDGLPDYVVDFREARCTERETAFSGTGGWDVTILVARRTGEPVRVFAGRVLDYDVTGDPKRPMVRFMLHGSYCGRAGADGCVKRRRLHTRPFAFRN